MEESPEVFALMLNDISLGNLSVHVRGAIIKEWTIDRPGKYPDWVKELNNIFASMKVGDKIQKRNIKKLLEIEDYELKRWAKENPFKEILKAIALLRYRTKPTRR